jgi:hypothetical protein
VPRNRRAVLSTALFTVIVALTGTLLLFLGSAAQAAGRSPAPAASKATAPKVTAPKAKVTTHLSELLAGDPWAGNEFGWSVSISGSTAVVGAPYAQSYTGAAYVYTKVGSAWSQVAELSASDGAVGDEFGFSVSISGTTIAVGAPHHYYGLGSAYVFSDAGGTWTQAAELPDTEATGSGLIKYGYSVVTSGTEVMVGADGYDGNLGAVYVFGDSTGTWTQVQKLLAPDGTGSDEFGWSMAVSGSTLLVSAVRHAANGAVYVFTASGGVWAEVTELKAGDGAPDDYFGDKVAISGSRIVAGAPGHNLEQGAAYVFTGSGATWTQTGEMTASDGQHNDCFGWAVGISGTTILVGAEQTNADNGAAYVFKKTGSTWTQKHELTETDGGPAAEFGYSAALSGTTAIVGADQAENTDGSAYLYKV